MSTHTNYLHNRLIFKLENMAIKDALSLWERQSHKQMVVFISDLETTPTNVFSNQSFIRTHPDFFLSRRPTRDPHCINNVVWTDAHRGSETRHFVSHKRTKIVATRHISWPQNLPRCFCGRALRRRPHWKSSRRFTDLLVLPGPGGHFLANRGMEE